MGTTATTGTLTKGEATRHAILEAAIARFGREGYRSTSVADIARDAEVGSTVPYAYFANKEALFLAAIDDDAASLIAKGLETIAPAESDDASGSSLVLDWRSPLVLTLVAAMDDHPLARRLLGGLEPEVTARVLEIPALAELRAACGERIRAEQASGAVRSDIDAETMGNGIIAIVLSLLMSVVQIGEHATLPYAEDVTAVFEAALNEPAKGTRPGR